MTGSLAKYAAFCLCVLAIAAQAQRSVAAEDGAITGLTVSQDLSCIEIRHNGNIGNYSSFVMGHPFRLVLDVGSARLAKIPGKIKVSRTPIQEIRLGCVNSRTRVVVDFGDNPVPPFTIERGAREIRVNMGKRLALGAADGERGRDKPKAQLSSWAKAAASTEAQKRHEPATRLKSARLEGNKVLLELSDGHNPDTSCHLAVEIDRKTLNVRGATLKDSRGTVKRFDLAAAKATVPNVKVQTVEPWDRMDNEVKDSDRPRDGKSKFTWGLESAQRAEKTLSGPTKKGAFKLERFVLRPRSNNR